MFPTILRESGSRFAPPERGGILEIVGSINISSLRDEELRVLGSDYGREPFWATPRPTQSYRWIRQQCCISLLTGGRIVALGNSRRKKPTE